MDTVQKLLPNKKNPRLITDEKLKLLDKSLKEFGDLSGIIFNQKTKQLVGGHQRTKLISKSTPIVIEKKYSKPTRTGTVAEGYIVIADEKHRYREVVWSLSKEKAANIAANKGAGEWDFPQLGEWMQDLEKDGIDLDLTLFDEGEREKLLKKEIAAVEGEDEVPEVKESITKPGDLWQLGKHRMMCGDSTNIQHVEQLMAGEKADMVFTDPPYGMKLDADFSRAGGPNFGNHSKGAYGGKYKNIQGDHMDFKPDLIHAIFAIPSKEIFIWGADYFAELIPNRNDGSWVVWDKCTRKDGQVAGEEIIGSNFELCWSKSKHKRELARFMHKGLASCENDKRVHPTQKPVALAAWFFEHWGKESKNVIDLYLGSGSTLIACEKTNRKCFGMEIDPHYCDVIVARWEKFTGKKAHLEKQGKIRRKK